MVTDREAKVWMVAALAVFVWACTMVGCAASTATTTPTSEVAVSGLADDFAWLAATDGHRASPPVTLTADSWLLADSLEYAATAPQATLVTDLAPAQPDFIRRSPRDVPINLDLGLSGLSIAHPLLSAKRLLVAGVTQLHRLPQPIDDVLAMHIGDAEAIDRPLAAATAADLRLEINFPDLSPPVETAGLLPEQPAWFIADGSPPRPSSPLPAPAMGAAILADEAKFDSAGIIGLVLGAMVLLFGGEAIVLLMLNRNQAAAKAKLRVALEAEYHEEAVANDEPSIFRLPEPINETPQESTRSRAA